MILLQNEPYDQQSALYLDNLQKSIPPFITTDLMLHQMYQFYGSLENEIEATYLADILKTMLEIINVELYSSYEKTLDQDIEKAIEESLLYYSIPYAVITGNKTNLIGNYNQVYYAELEKILNGEGTGSELINSNEFNYQIFKPYGHYAKNDKTEKYFKALTWLQKINLCLNVEDEFYRAILIAYIINKSEDLKNNYREYMELKTYFSSQKDQFTFWDLAKVIESVEGIKIFEDLYKEETLQQIREMLHLEESESCQIRVSLMPVEYQNLYTDLSQIIKDTETPSPEKMFAALGMSAGQSADQNRENDQMIMDNLLSISTQEEAKSMDWLSTLLTSLDNKRGLPRTININSWKMKSLNAAMASWVQLNERVNIQIRNEKTERDSIETSMLLRGYVEPNIAFWNAASTLLQNTGSFLGERHMLSNNASVCLNELLDLMTFFKTVSEKEINNQTLQKEEYNRIASIGMELQGLTFKQLKTGYTAENQKISNSQACATNVYRGGKNKNLIAGIGKAHQILVPVKIDGHIYLTVGSVYSYYEIKDYPNSNIGKTQWANILNHEHESHPDPWMKDYYSTVETPDTDMVARH